MKLVFRSVLFVAILFSFACTKESGIGDFDSKKVSIDVSALVEELNADEKTKSEVLLVMRHFWSEADVVYAYDNTKLLGSLRVTPINNNRDAQLTGTIDAPSSKAGIITLIYCNTADKAPVIDDGGKVTFDFSTQNGSKIPCVVYGTIDYSNQSTITNQVVTFHFATSFMELTVTGLNDTGVDSILISGVNTVCELTVKPDAGPGIAGNAVGTIKKTGNITKSGERAIFAVAIVQDKHTNRVITVAQGEKRFKSNFTAAGLNGNAVYFSVYALKEELTGTLLGHEYVVIAGKKWATMNVGATEVVGPNSYGDYYVWGTTETAYSGIDRANGTFVFKEANPYGNRLGVEWQPAVGFDIKNMPFTNKVYKPIITNVFVKYIFAADKRFGAGEGFHDDKAILDPEDDVAKVKWGGSWRMPTKEDFQELLSSTYCVWDGYDKGYYLYSPLDGDAGKINDGTVSLYEYKGQKPLLFFPAAGVAEGLVCSGLNEKAFYLSSSNAGHQGDDSEPPAVYGMAQGSVSKFVSRYRAYSVRPVSDMVEDSSFDVTGVSLNVTELSLGIGETATLTATVYPAIAEDKTVVWSSADTSVATVDQSGLVTAIYPGKTTVSVKTNDGNKIATCTVTVVGGNLEKPKDGGSWAWD